MVDSAIGARLAGGLRAWAARPALVAAVTFVGAFVLQYPALYMGGVVNSAPSGQLWLFLDEATVAYDSARIASGEVMYRDFFQFQGPVHYHIYAAVFGLFGRSFFLSRLLFVFTTSVSAALIAIISLRLLRGRDRTGAMPAAFGAVVAGWLHTTMFTAFWPCAYPHWTAEAFGLGGLALATVARPSRRTRILVGVLWGTSAWTILSLGFPVLVAGTAAFALPGLQERDWKKAVRHPLEVGAGALAFSLVVVAVFAGLGALPELVYATVIWPVESYGHGQGDVTEYAAYFGSVVNEHAKLGSPWRLLGRILAEVVRSLPLIAFLAVLPAAFRSAQTVVAAAPSAPHERDCITVIAASAAACSPLVLEVSRTDMVHLAFVGSFGLLGTMAAWSLFSSRRFTVSLGGPAVALVSVLGAWSYLGIVARTERDPRDWKTYLLELPTTKRIMQHLEPDSTLFDTGYWGGLRYFYIADAAVPFTFVPSKAAFGYYTEAQWERLAAALVENEPDCLHISSDIFEKVAGLRPELRERYRARGGNIYLLAP